MALGRGNIEIDIRGNVDTAGIARQVTAAEKQIRPLNISLNDKGFRQPLGRISGDIAEFQKSLDASVARTLAFGAAVGVINAVSDGFKSLVQSAVEVEKALTDINVILNLNSGGLQNFSDQLFDVAKNTGQSFQTIAEAAVELSRQGLGAEETLSRINDAMILTRLSGMDAAKSVETLTAAINSFGDTALTTTSLVNKLASVDAAFAVSTEDLANALARSGASAQAAKVDLNELLAAVTSVQQITARGGSVIGNAFKSIFTRLQRSGVREALEEIGVATTDAAGNIRGALDILQDYATVYGTLTDSQRAYTDELVAGVFQINNLRALVKDLGSDYSIYQRALEESNGATDQAVRRNEKLQKTLSSLINESAANAKELASSLGELIATPGLENLLEIFNSIAGALRESLDPEQGFSLIRTMFDSIGRFISGPGLVIIGAAFIKLFKFITQQSLKAVQEVFKIGSAANKVADAEAKIGFLLKNNRTLYEAISNEALTHEQREELVLQTIKQQNRAYEQQQALISRLAKARTVQSAVNVTSKAQGFIPRASKGYMPHFAEGTDFSPNKLRKGKEKAKASGFIPNFSSEIEGAIHAEKSAISAGVGGASKSAKPKVLKNFPMGGGKRQTIVANTDEVIVPRFGGGTGSAIFNQEMIKKAGMPGDAIPVSNGYIPNYAQSKLQTDKVFQDLLSDFQGVDVDVQRDMSGFGMLTAKGKRGNLETTRKPGFSREDKLKIIDSIGGSKLNKDDKSFLLTTIGGKKKTRFSNIPAQTIESADPEKISGKVGALNNLINPHIADAVAEVATNIYTRVLGDEVSAQNLVKNVRASANADQGIVSKGAQGAIFESAIRLGSKESAKNLAKDDKDAIWDFEESSAMSADLKALFFPTSNIYKADAKRTGDQNNLREVVDKAYKADFSDQLREIYARNWSPIVSAAAKVAPSKQKTERKRTGTNLAGGFIPNFITSIPDDAIRPFQASKDFFIPPKENDSIKTEKVSVLEPGEARLGKGKAGGQRADGRDVFQALIDIEYDRRNIEEFEKISNPIANKLIDGNVEWLNKIEKTSSKLIDRNLADPSNIQGIQTQVSNLQLIKKAKSKGIKAQDIVAGKSAKGTAKQKKYWEKYQTTIKNGKFKDQKFMEKGIRDKVKGAIGEYAAAIKEGTTVNTKNSYFDLVNGKEVKTKRTTPASNLLKKGANEYLKTLSEKNNLFNQRTDNKKLNKITVIMPRDGSVNFQAADGFIPNFFGDKIGWKIDKAKGDYAITGSNSKLSGFSSYLKEVSEKDSKIVSPRAAEMFEKRVKEVNAQHLKDKEETSRRSPIGFGRQGAKHYAAMDAVSRRERSVSTKGLFIKDLGKHVKQYNKHDIFAVDKFGSYDSFFGEGYIPNLINRPLTTKEPTQPRKLDLHWISSVESSGTSELRRIYKDIEQSAKVGKPYTQIDAGFVVGPRIPKILVEGHKLLNKSRASGKNIPKMKLNGVMTPGDITKYIYRNKEKLAAGDKFTTKADYMPGEEKEVEKYLKIMGLNPSSFNSVDLDEIQMFRNGFAGGFIPNFANQVYDKDKIQPQEAGEILQNILSNKKKKDLLIGPSGVGKSTLAAKYGEFIKSIEDAKEASSYTILSGAGKTKAGGMSPALLKIIEAVNGSGGKVSYLSADDKTIEERREKRISKPLKGDLRSEGQLKGTRFAPKNQPDFANVVKRAANRFEIINAAQGVIPNFALSNSMIEGLRAKLRPGSGATEAEKKNARKILDKEERSTSFIKDAAIIDDLQFSKKQVQGAIADVTEKRNSLNLDSQPIAIEQKDITKFAEEYIKKVNRAKRAFTNEKLFGTPLSTSEISMALKGQGGYQRGKYIPKHFKNMADGYIPNFANFVPNYVMPQRDFAKFSVAIARFNRKNLITPPLKALDSRELIKIPKRNPEVARETVENVRQFISSDEYRALDPGIQKEVQKHYNKIAIRTGVSDASRPFTRHSDPNFEGRIAAAKGLIPNFANELQEAIVREEQALKDQGSSAKVYVDQDNRLKDRKNPMGLLVANRRDEPGGGFQGVNRAMSMGMNPKVHGMASGYIPNYVAGGAIQSTNFDSSGFKKLTEQTQKAANQAKIGADKIRDLGKAAGDTGEASDNSMGRLLAFSIGLSTIESTLAQVGGPAFENFSLQATQASIAVAELGGNLTQALSKQLGSLGQTLSSKKGLGGVGGLLGGLGKTVGRLVPVIGPLSVAGGLLYDAYENGAFKTLGLYNKQKELIKSTTQYTKTLEEQQNKQAQSIEKVDKFSVVLSKLGKAAQEGNIDAYGKFLQELTEQAGELDNIDPTAFRELLNSAGDAKKLNEATQALKDLINQGSQLTNFQKDFADLTKEIAEADGDLDKVNAGKKIQEIGKTLVSGLNLDQMKQLVGGLADFDGSSQDSANTLLKLQSVFGNLDSETKSYIRQNEGLSKSLLLSVKSQAGYKVAADNLTQAYIKARSPVQNLNAEFSKLALAIDNSIKNIRASFSTLSEVGKIEAESRTKTLEATSVVTPQASAQGQAIADLARAQQEASQDIKTSLQSFASETIKSAEKNSQVLKGPIKTLVDGIKSGDVNLNAAISSLREIQQTGNAEQKDSATKALDTIRGANQEFISSQKVIDATLRAQLQESAIQSAIFRRENQLSEGQLKTLIEFNNASKTNLERLSGLKESIDLVRELGGNEDILAELKAGNRQRSELENLEAAFSKFTGQAFDAINLDDLESQVDSFIASDRFSELDTKTQSLVAALTGAFDKINKFELQDKGVSSAEDVGAAKTISTPDEAIKSLATEFETFSQTLATGLKLDPESIKSLSSTESIQSIAESIKSTSETNQQNLAKNAELQKAQTEALITAASKIDSSGSKLDSAAGALLEAAKTIRATSGTSASGFVPSFSANSQAVTRAITTERNLGGKPVVDYNSAVGTYVRDGNTQPNFAAVKRDHPEGLKRAAENSKTLQGMAASRGFVPNFFGSAAGVDFTGTGGNFNQSFEPTREQIIAGNSQEAREALEEKGYQAAISAAIIGNTGAFDKSLFLGSAMRLPFDRKPWRKILNTNEYAKKFYNSVYNAEQPSFSGADKIYTESTKQSFENLQKSFFESMEKESKLGNLWDVVLENKTTARKEFKKYFNQNKKLFTSFDLSKDAYDKNVYQTMSPLYNLRDQINNAYLHNAIGTVAGPLDKVPRLKSGLENPYSFKIPVTNGASLAYVPAVTSLYKQNFVSTGDYSRVPGFAKHVLLKNVADKIQDIHYRDDLVLPYDIKYNLKNEQGETISPTAFLDIDVTQGRKNTSSIRDQQNKITELDTLERVIQNKISANDQYIEKKKGDLYMLKNPLIDPDSGLMPVVTPPDQIKKLESHIKDVQDQKTIFQSQISKHKLAKEYIQKNLEYAHKYKNIPNEQFATNPIYLNDSGKEQKLKSWSSSKKNSSINNLSTWFHGLKLTTLKENNFKSLISGFKENVFNTEFNKNNSEAKKFIETAYNTVLPTALKNLSLTPKEDYSQAVQNTIDEIKNYKLKSPVMVEELKSAKTERQKKTIEKDAASSAKSQLESDTAIAESYSEDLFPQTFAESLKETETIIQGQEKSSDLLDLFHNAILGRSAESEYAAANANIGEIAERFARQKSMAEQATSNKKAFIENQIKGRKNVLPRYEKFAGNRTTPQQKKSAERAEILKREIRAIEKHAEIYDNSDAIKYIMFEDMRSPLLMDGKPIYPMIPTAPDDYAERFEKYEKIFERYQKYKDSGSFLKLNPNNQFANQPWSEDYARIHTGTFLDQFSQQNYDQRVETLKRLGADIKLRNSDTNPFFQLTQEQGRNDFLANLKNSATTLPEKYLYDRIGFLVANEWVGDVAKFGVTEKLSPTFKKLQTIGMPLLPNAETNYIPQIKLISAERIDGGPGTQEYSGPVVSELLTREVMTEAAKLQQAAFYEKNKKFYEDAGIKLLPEMLAGKKIEFNKYPQYLDWLAEKSGSGFKVSSFVNQMLNDTESVANFDSWRNKYVSDDFTSDKSTVKRLSLYDEYGAIRTSDPVLQKNEVVKRFFQAEEINPFAFIDGDNTTPFGALKFAMGDQLKHGKNVNFEENLRDTSDPLAALNIPKIESVSVSAGRFINNAYDEAGNIKNIYAPFGYTKEHAVDSPVGAAASDPDIVTRLEEALKAYKTQTTNEGNVNARGFVPNFSAVAGEIIASKAAGYNTPVTSSQVKTMSIPGVGKTAYNTQESVFKLPGMTQPFIAPPSDSDAAKPYKQEVQKKFNFNPYQKTAADGFIPNFARGMDFTDFESAVSAFRTVTNGFGKHISSFGKVISSLDFKQFATASSEIQQAAKTFSAQSDNFKQAAEKIRSSADKFSSQSAQAPEINLGGLNSAVAKFSGGITRLSNKLDKKLQVDAGSINTALDKLTTALGKIQGSIQVKVPDVNVNVQGNVSSAVSSAIKSEIPTAVKNALDSANIEGLVQDKIREFMQ